MSRVDDFYSIDENRKPAVTRFYHNNSDCSHGHKISLSERRMGQAAIRSVMSAGTTINKSLPMIVKL
jgi:hypothetical protein